MWKYYGKIDSLIFLLRENPHPTFITFDKDSKLFQPKFAKFSGIFIYLIYFKYSNI